ncbi:MULTISPECIES: flagellar biosynthesis repressor FlbT [unclassified Roseitalea]|uniref:flagellar biosynthesis repressor FlbT n=1 Tax=unclassified Roseitalea TaxID=2639107 RepID=UPI00273DCA56|nr:MULTISPECIES: flagellar biosynthesis repressor FlbT [unclassified Roseitalea]
MKGSFKLFLKANEKVFINGAVIKVDRKVGFELLNDVDFLLEHHVMQVEDATTPLRQLYFVIQIMLMSPSEKPAALQLYRDSVKALMATFQDRAIVDELARVDAMIGEDRPFEALKLLRSLFEAEAEVLSGEATPLARDEAPVRRAAAGG